jgi:6-pyruvoyltetrahydropterin/6-carboxytetrahydropterin synthase
MTVSLTRRYRFSASHRLHSFELSPAENARLFGKCNNIHGHGHDYTLEVTASGVPDALTGLLLPVAALDELVQRHVLSAFAWRNINLDLPQFETRTATTENVALVIADLLQANWHRYLAAAPAHLTRIYIQETERNGFELSVGAAEARSALHAAESAVYA